MGDSKAFDNRHRNPSKERSDAEMDAASATCFQSELSSLHEVSVIENMTSFLLEHGGADVDSKVLRTIAEALSKRVHDTSPSTLKDVTMEHSYGVGFQCVSLQGHGTTSPPVQGRSVREFEEQMASLRKENFNLKLRLYFLEESVPGYHQSNQENQESLMKQLIDTKVEIEILRKELEEKQELLKEAAQAMNHMEQIQKETESKGQAFIEELKQKIQFLEMERDLEKTNQSEFMNDFIGRSEISENVNTLQKIRELEGMVSQSAEKMLSLQTQNDKFEEIIMKRDETIKEYEEKVKELVFQNAEQQEMLENKERDIANIELNLKSLRLTNVDLKEDNRNLINALKITQDNFRKEFSNMKVCEKRMREQQDALSKMQIEVKEKKVELANKLCELDDTQQELKKLRKSYDAACRTLQQLLQREKNQQDGSNRALSDTEALHSNLQKCDHESIIKSLEAEVKKKTADLQNLVNKELWQKNREIERLTKLLNANATSPLSPTVARKNLEALQLQQSFTETDYTKALEHNKLLQRKVDVLNQRIIGGRANEALIEELRQEARKARAEAENAETCRLAYSKVFAVLSDRLYELAGFLNSLMKHKEVLSFLSTERRRAMRTAVDCSLDLSTSIRETLTTGDQSFEGLSNLSRLLLDDVEMPDGGGMGNKTFNSHDNLRARHSFDVLRSENKALRRILDSRRSCGGAGAGAEYAKDAKERRSLPPFLLGDLSESEAWSEPDRQVSMARIGLEEHATSATGTGTKDAVSKLNPPSADTDSESETEALQQSRAMKARNLERIAQLEKLVAQRDDRILMIQFQLVEADNSLKKETLRALALTDEVDQLRQRNEELLTDLITIGSEQTKDENNTTASESALLNKSLLQRQVDEKSRAVEQLQAERDRIAVEARLAEVQVAALKADIEDIKQKYEIQLKLASDKELQRLDTLKKELEQLMQQRLKEQERVHKETLVREWIARTTYDECRAQLAELQTQYIEAQRNIDYLTDNEQELKQTLVNSEMEVRTLKKQLDESVLQASKVVTERTKLCNEKLQLEKRLMELQQKLSAAETQHMATMQRVTELERLQRTLNEQLQQAQAATASVKRLNASDVSQSGYGSDEVQKSSTKRESNSSPDLGIHSDTGGARVSSVEFTNMQRSLLKTVPAEMSTKEETTYNSQEKSTLTSKRPQHSSSSDLGIDSDMGRMSSMDVKKESPNRTDTDDSNTENKMSVANVQTRPTNSGANSSATGTSAIHDCVKVEQENSELRRKLVQTKRAFEETYKKLHISNQRKENFEKEIKDQILKTKNVLKYARFHMAKVQQPNTHQQQLSQTTTAHQAQHLQLQSHEQQDQRNVTNDDCSGPSTSKSNSSHHDALH